MERVRERKIGKKKEDVFPFRAERKLNRLSQEREDKMKERGTSAVVASVEGYRREATLTNRDDVRYSFS